MSRPGDSMPQTPGTTPRVSVIIPALNEAARIAETIAAARAAGADEVVVVDGGSRDATIPQAAGADRVLSSLPGRAVQQNRGAAVATGNVLVFLHADCLPAPGSITVLRDVLNRDPDIVGGCFQQRIDAAGWAYRLWEWGNLRRVLWWRMAYGDQGLFLRRDVFTAIGGFPEWPLMEDVGLMERLRGRGRFVVLWPRLVVSARRWRKRGLLRQTALNWTLLTLYALGVAPKHLARLYTHVR